MTQERLDTQQVKIVAAKKEDVEIASKNGLVKLYQDIFCEPPYYENFSDEEVTSFFQEYVNDGKVFLAYDHDKVIGFGASLPIQSVPQIEKIIKDTGVDADNCWYMADLGVDKSHRGNGIARDLVQKRIDAAPEGSKILMRTSVNNVASQSLYRSLGFVDVPGAFEYVNSPRTDGSINSDKRLFLIRDRG